MFFLYFGILDISGAKELFPCPGYNLIPKKQHIKEIELSLVLSFIDLQLHILLLSKPDKH